MLRFDSLKYVSKSKISLYVVHLNIQNTKTKLSEGMKFIILGFGYMNLMT